MRFHADLHVHSKYSRATSSDCDLFHLSLWARRKGIAVIGTGDFTHPAWMAELKASLRPAEPGLYRLREDLERAVAERLAAPCRGETRFMLSVEISTIYKKGDKTRKIHHLIYAPDFEAADRLVQTLSKIGNLTADGRPILGLDSRHLLEAVLSSGEGSYLVPAHIWTPWFSVLGSKAGFDAVEDCYGDLSPHIFALETGLSSDPAMNWRLSALDKYRLVSSSDAHSPPKLGREATVFDTPLDYFEIRHALMTGQGFGGTVEFFPEEGKYHLDGHRKCNVALPPAETRARGVRCPACGQPLTVGVLHRVEDLADREEGLRPECASDFKNLVPLPEVLAELAGTGASSKTVQRTYDGLLSRLGPELFVLEQAPREDIERASTPLLGEAITRMRAGQVIRHAGYDGEYGVIRLFEPEELRTRVNGGLLFGPGIADRPATVPVTAPVPAPAPVTVPAPVPATATAPVTVTATVPVTAPASVLDNLDPDQRAAAEIALGPLLILAGPGTGKTRTLTHRVAHLVAEQGVAPEHCLVITFTRRAADELRDRLRALLGDAGERVPAMTFHALGLSILREHADGGGRRIAGERERAALLASALGVPERRAERALAEISRWKRIYPRHAQADELPIRGSEIDRAWQLYEETLDAHGLWDFDDLVGLAVDLLETRPEVAAEIRGRFRYLSIDEYQDVDERQVRLVRALAPAGGNVCAIGDPDQAIYGFRGADVRLFLRFEDDFPGAQILRLRRNYRSTPTILEASLQVIAPSPTLGAREIVPFTQDRSAILIHEAPTARAEAEHVVHTIERMIGGSTFFSMDSGRVASPEAEANRSFSDFAILVRTDAQTEALREALARSGMPFQRRSHGRLAERAAVAAIAEALSHARPLAQDLKDAACRVREAIAAPPAQDSMVEGAPMREVDVDAALSILLSLAERAGGDAARFALDLATEAEIDAWDPRADRISVLTLHAAKGLEFRVVFLVGCEDGLLPLRFPNGEGPPIDEERRLFYVGMTRAKERLVLTRVRERARHGSVVLTEMSPFVREIEARLLERREAPSRASRRGRKQLTLL